MRILGRTLGRMPHRLLALAAGLWLGVAMPAGDQARVPDWGHGAAAAPGISAVRQTESPFALYLPAVARSGDAPRPGAARVEDLLSGIAPAVAWSGDTLFATVGRTFGDFSERPPVTIEPVLLPGSGRAVAPLDEEGLAIVLAAGTAQTRSNPGSATTDTLLVVAAYGQTLASVSLGGRAVDVRTANGRAYVATNSPPAIQVFNATDPESPRDVARALFAADEAPQDLEIADGALWVSVDVAGNVRLQSWTVTNPDLPVELGTLGLPSTGGRRAMIAAGRGRVFAVSADGVLEIDASDPGRPRLIGPIRPATPCASRAIDVAVPPTQVGPPQLIVAGTGCLEWRVWIDGAWEVDRSATHERAFEFPPFGSLLAAGSTAHVADAHGAAGGVTHWTDIPPNAFDLPGNAACLAARGDDVLALAGDALWFLDPHQEPGGRPMTTAPPARLGFSDPARCALAAAGNRVVIAADDLYTIVDVSDPDHPEAGRASRIPELNGGVAADERRAYLSAGAGGLLVRPLDPADTIQGGVVLTPGSANDVALGASHLFVADGAAGLSVFDAAGEGLPRHVVTLPMAMDARNVYYADGMLAVTLVRSADSHRWWQGDFALAMVDVASPIKPEVRSVRDLPGMGPGRPFITAGRVLVPAGDRLHQLNVSDPRRPHLDWTARDPIRSAVTAGGTTLAALGEVGLAVVTWVTEP